LATYFVAPAYQDKKWSIRNRAQ